MKSYKAQVSESSSDDVLLEFSLEAKDIDDAFDRAVEIADSYDWQIEEEIAVIRAYIEIRTPAGEYIDHVSYRITPQAYRILN